MDYISTMTQLSPVLTGGAAAVILSVTVCTLMMKWGLASIDRQVATVKDSSSQQIATVQRMCDLLTTQLKECRESEKATNKRMNEQTIQVTKLEMKVQFLEARDTEERKKLIDSILNAPHGLEEGKITGIIKEAHQ